MMMARHPEGPGPFDHGNDRDPRGQVPDEVHTTHVLKPGETVHFTDGSRPTHAPDTTAARNTHHHGRLRRAFNRHFPAGTKRGTAVRAGAVAVGIGTAGYGLTGGAEQAGRTAEHVGHDVAAFVGDGPSDSTAATESYAGSEVTTTEAEQRLDDAAADQRVAEAGANATGIPDPSEAGPGEPEPEAAAGRTASTATPAPEAEAPSQTGGFAAENTPDTGGVDGTGSDTSG